MYFINRYKQLIERKLKLCNQNKRVKCVKKSNLTYCGIISIYNYGGLIIMAIRLYCANIGYGIVFIYTIQYRLNGFCGSYGLYGLYDLYTSSLGSMGYG